MAWKMNHIACASWKSCGIYSLLGGQYLDLIQIKNGRLPIAKDRDVQRIPRPVTCHHARNRRAKRHLPLAEQGE